MKTVIGRYLLLILTLCVFLAAMTFGIVKRQTYKDMLKQEDYPDQLFVAELSENLVEMLMFPIRMSKIMSFCHVGESAGNDGGIKK